MRRRGGCKVQGARCKVPRRSRELCTEGDLQSRWATATDADEKTGLWRGYAPAREGCDDEMWWWRTEQGGRRSGGGEGIAGI